MIIKSESLSKIATALAEFQKHLEVTPKNSKKVNAGRIKYSYIELPELINALRPQLATQGLTLIQSPYNNGSELGVETMLIHSSGEFIKSSFGSQLSRTDAQSVGSQITYYRRYAILSVLGLGQEDDDGATATQGQRQQQKEQPSPQSKPSFKLENGASDYIKKQIQQLLSQEDLVKYESLFASLTSEQGERWLNNLKSKGE